MKMTHFDETTDLEKARFVGALIENRLESNRNDFFNAFQDYFKDRPDFDACINSLEEEKDKITELGFYYNLVTKEIGHAGITLIAIFSIMEALSRYKFQSFDQWLLAEIKEKPENIPFPIEDRKEFKTIIVSLREKYLANHGSSEKVRRFVSKYFSDEDKNILVNGFQVKENISDLNALNLSDKVKAIIDMLYKERNAFVHQARLPQVFDQKVKIFGCCNIKNKNTFISIQISINEIKKMFEKAFIRFIKGARLKFGSTPTGQKMPDGSAES